ncbi:nitroreductase family deazaflavin-dependent oxidoreductase [Microbacterium sp.]|uniref:nitroreductase family deazaflavin-dependent oxidoreductase n=1 Tax=Microbacterium sp. TaxID=51671 RepID=UPI002E2F1A80|nr:nitroreductase family deazaflavin-dependent oxidoreductase [Microbacterium sp.]HEX5729488.1 nitroreductase family deazaflavin-dependent oxidoreductase [Microbacterium sp.]
MAGADKRRNFRHRMLNRLHRALLALSGGRLGSTLASMPVVELHTIGRLTGTRRTVLLTSPVHDSDRYVLVASKGGAPRHPSWYLNLLSHPDLELTVRGRTLALRARTATGEERDELWRAIVGADPGYARYQHKTRRKIPVVVCEPRR